MVRPALSGCAVRFPVSSGRPPPPRRRRSTPEALPVECSWPIPSSKKVAATRCRKRRSVGPLHRRRETRAHICAAPGTAPKARALGDHLARRRKATLLAKLPDPDCALRSADGPSDRDEAVPYGVLDQLGRGPDPERFHDARSVELRGPRGDVQEARDLLGRPALGGELQDLPLARG